MSVLDWFQLIFLPTMYHVVLLLWMLGDILLDVRHDEFYLLGIRYFIFLQVCMSFALRQLSYLEIIYPYRAYF